MYSIVSGSAIASGTICAVKGAVDFYNGKRSLGRAEMAVGVLTVLGGLLNSYYQTVAVNAYTSKPIANDPRLDACRKTLIQGAKPSFPSFEDDDFTQMYMSPSFDCDCWAWVSKKGMNKMMEMGWSWNMLPDHPETGYFKFVTEAGQKCYGYLVRSTIV